MINTEKFITFLESLRTEDNTSAINSIFEGFTALFEYPSFVVGDISVDDEEDNNVDLHVENINEIEGEQHALHYVNDILQKLYDREGIIEVPSEYLRDYEMPNVNASQITDERERNTLILYLQRIKKGLESRVKDLVPA